MEFLKDIFPSNKQPLTDKPLEGDPFRARVRENKTAGLKGKKAALSKALKAEPPEHPAQLFYALQKLSQFALELGMLDWRSGTDPRPLLSEINMAFSVALEKRPDILPGETNPGFMAIISSLMGWDIPFNTEPPKEEEYEFEMIWMDRWIIAGLADSACWPEKDSAPPLKNKFINQCLDDYWALLTEQVEPEEGMKRCIKNYDRRATNQTFKNLPPVDCGGKYNALYIDYTLAAIMKKRGIVSNSVHDWVWG